MFPGLEWDLFSVTVSADGVWPLSQRHQRTRVTIFFAAPLLGSIVGRDIPPNLNLKLWEETVSFLLQLWEFTEGGGLAALGHPTPIFISFLS